MPCKYPVTPFKGEITKRVAANILCPSLFTHFFKPYYNPLNFKTDNKLFITILDSHLVNICCTYWAYLHHILGIYLAHLWYIYENLWHLLGISLTYLGHILGVKLVYLMHIWTYLWHWFPHQLSIHTRR